MPRDARKVRFASEEHTQTNSIQEREPALICMLQSLISHPSPSSSSQPSQSLGRTRTNKDFEAAGHHARPGELVIPAAPKAAGNQVIRPLPQSPDVFNEPEDITMDYMDVDPSPSQINPLAPKPDFQPGSSKKHSLDVLALQSPSGQAMYRHILESQICMPGQIPMILGKSDLACKRTYAWIWSLRIISQVDTLATRISYQATPHPRKIDYKEGLDDPLNRAMEDYQQMFSAACKHRGSVLEWQKSPVYYYKESLRFHPHIIFVFPWDNITSRPACMNVVKSRCNIPTIYWRACKAHTNVAKSFYHIQVAPPACPYVDWRACTNVAKSCCDTQAGLPVHTNAATSFYAIYPGPSACSYVTQSP
ncbi:hypothetical protein BDN67DRAFT_984750 [Paxillus ammoniavirescens]|nr:hypothetical protein BDN67DRAFT_984750 [Paxillus ammoniavirescens]